MASVGDKQLVGSLTKGLRIIEALMERDSMGVTEVSNMLEVNKSSAYRLLLTLADRGFVSQDSQNGKYRLTVKMPRFQQKPIEDAHLRNLSEPFMRKLTELTNESSGLAVMAGSVGILIGNCMSNELITATLSIGMSEPFYCTALGKVLFCGQSESERERLMKGIQYEALTPKTIVNEEDFRRDISRTIERGVALDDEEYSLDMRCIAAPVRAHNGQVVAAIGISGPLSRMRTESIPAKMALVREIADECSAILPI